MVTFFQQRLLDIPHENGITLFILGGLSVLSVYHFLLYFQHKDKSYLLYSFYTFLLFIRNLPEPQDSFIYSLEILHPILNTLDYYSINLEWMYNTIYFAFAFTFLDLKSYSKKWYRFIFRGIYSLLAANIIVEIIHRVMPDIHLYKVMFPVFIISLLLFSIIGYIPLFKIKGYLKYYIIVGSLIFLVTSLVAFFISKLHLQPDGSKLNISIFFIGMALENIFFALGLGHKQKLILQEKNEAQERLIIELKHNEKLKIEINKKLEKDLREMSDQAENEKLEKLKVTYEKELAELKVSSLRSQMNPHFIFNSLNAIKLYIIKNEKENAVYYLNKFSKLIRRILSSTRKKEVSLSEELEIMELYISIENIRFKNELELTMDIDKRINLNTVKIPSLTLQPFIENAIWHGLSAKEGIKKLAIRVKQKKGSHIKITIEDNGIGREKSAIINSKKIRSKKSIGIKLTQERLKNFVRNYQYNYTLKFLDLYDRRNNPVGTRVTIKIPIS